MIKLPLLFFYQFAWTFLGHTGAGVDSVIYYYYYFYFFFLLFQWHPYVRKPRVQVVYWYRT